MRTFIIAEAGVNHNGRLESAKKLIDSAFEAGADAVKFQTFKAEKVTSKFTEKAEYQKKVTGAEESQFDMLKKLELSYENFKGLYDYAKQKGIIFLSTPFDIDSAKFLRDLGLEVFKIPSGEITNYLLLREIGSYNKKVIMSTGMSSLCDIENAINVLTEFGTKKGNITVLHCNTEYPSPLKDVNLKAMLTIKEAFKINAGYSDHTLGIEVPIAATALGATVIEKHFTLDKNMIGPDHKASLDPKELKKMVDAIRNIEKAMGSSIKKPSESELKNRNIIRKSITAKKPIKKGEIFTEENLTVKRPGTGISPMKWNEVVGRLAQKPYDTDDIIEI